MSGWHGDEAILVAECDCGYEVDFFFSVLPFLFFSWVRVYHNENTDIEYWTRMAEVEVRRRGKRRDGWDR